jgi:hypothetical protein
MKNLWVVCCVLFVLGCKSNSDGTSSTSSELNSIVDGADIVPVSLLKSLSEEELMAVSEGCPRGSGRDLCVAICHVPPGNPSKAKTLLIPHQAIQAHLKHGSNKHNHHDFIGNCDQLPDLKNPPHPGCSNGKGKKPNCEIEDPGDDHDEDDHNDDDPIYCDPLDNRDVDCDGYDDEEGTPIQ